MCAKYYENLTMLSRVTAKNVGDVFLRHSVEANIDNSIWAFGIQTTEKQITFLGLGPMMKNK